MNLLELFDSATLDDGHELWEVNPLRVTKATKDLVIVEFDRWDLSYIGEKRTFSHPAVILKSSCALGSVKFEAAFDLPYRIATSPSPLTMYIRPKREMYW